MKKYVYIVVMFIFLFQPLLIAGTMKLNLTIDNQSIQVGKVDTGLKIMHAIKDSVEAVTVTNKELNTTDEKGTDWVTIVLVTLVALGSFYAIFQNDEE